jgi:hypothetical protein
MRKRIAVVALALFVTPTVFAQDPEPIRDCFTPKYQCDLAADLRLADCVASAPFGYQQAACSIAWTYNRAGCEAAFTACMIF